MPTAKAGPSASLIPRPDVTPDQNSSSDVDAAKARLRAKLKQRRAEAAAANGAAIAEVAATRFLDALPLQAGQVIAGYWPMADELDPRPLLRQLQARGAVIALPVAATKRATPLEFRLWADFAQAPPVGSWGIPAPAMDAPLLQPDIMLVPLVGFDKTGRRLGMGGGYYDATLAALRAERRHVLAVGYAFAVQQVPELPDGVWDQRLDWIVTERAAIACGKQV